MNILANMQTIGSEHFLLGAATALALGFWIRALVRIRLEWALLGALLVNASVFTWLEEDDRFWLNRPLGWDSQSQYSKITLVIFTSYIAACLGLALLVKVYRAIVLEKCTETERSTGLVCVRAWLAPLNAITVLVLSIAASVAFDWSFFGVFLLGVSLLLIYPLVGSFAQPADLAATPAQAAPEERQRVLALVESGKITAEDGAELLTALAQSQAAGIESEKSVSRPRRLMVLGAIVLLVGFFLPWFTENITQAMSAMASDMQRAMPQMPSFPAGPNGNSPIEVPVQMTNVLTLRGGDVRNGLGWIALAAGIVAAILPFFWSERAADPKPIRNITFAALGIGTVSLLYLLSNSFNAITTIEPGFFLAIAGFLLLWIGGVREYVAPRPRVHASLMTA